MSFIVNEDMFGRYCRIPTDTSGNMHIYKIVSRIDSNSYCDVLDGIRRTAFYLKNGNIKIHRSCVDSIAEFGLYRWDDKATADTVIKENDHAMDDIRYFCNTIMKNKVRKESNYTPIFMKEANCE